MAEKPKAILVLGMHRSGTSAITRVLNLLGLRLPSQLMAPVADNNEAGFWESERIAEVHDRLLAELDSSWDDCLRLPAGFEQSEIGRRYNREILQVLEEDFGHHAPFVIKDPRICRLVPFWLALLEQFGADGHLVLTARHPAEVAASLHKRDRFPRGKSYHLWLRHVLDMERDSRDANRSVVTYAGLLADWRRSVEVVESASGFSWPRPIAQAAPEIDRFLSSSLRHHRAEEDPSGDAIPLYGWAREVYDAFDEAALGRPLPVELFDRIAAELDGAEAIFAPVVGAVQTSLRHGQEAVEKRLRREHDRLQAELVDGHLQDRQTYEAEIARVRAAHRKDNQTYEAEVARIRSELDDSTARLSEQATAFDTFRDTAEARIADLDHELRETRHEKDWVWEQWHATKSELEAPQKSKVGRLIWFQWTSYLASRRVVIRARQKLSATHGEDPNHDVDGARSLPSRIAGLIGWAARGVTRPLTRAAGWIFLVGDTAWEQLRAATHQALRGPRGRRSTAPTPSPAARRPRVLLVSPYPIHPPHHGGGVRLFNLIRRLAEDAEIHLLVFSTEEDNSEQRQALSTFAASVHFHHWRPAFDPGWWYLQPPNAGLFRSDEAARQIAHLLATERIDILQLEYAELGQYGLPRFANVKVVLTEHDLAFRQHRRRRRMGFHERFPEGNAYGSSFGDWMRLLRYELAVCRRADQIHVMSQDDGEKLSGYLADAWKRIRVVPNAVDTDFYKPGDLGTTREGVLYVGNFQNLPNVDALQYLAEAIWPTVRARLPEASLTVVGAHPSDRVTRFDGRDGIEVVGEVPDLRPFYHRHRLMVAPIRAGSGTRLKILEAFAAGLPVVSTQLGAEGIEATHQEHLLLSETPDDFAAAIIELLGSEERCSRLASRALELVSESYDWQRSAEATLQGWHELLGSAASDHRPGLERDTPSAPPDAPTRQEAGGDPAASERRSVDISIIIPTFRGGDDLRRCLEAISRQDCDISYEVICVDSGSDEGDIATMQRFDARSIVIDQAEFDHGLTRDLGAADSRGRFLVFLNQDAVPGDDQWLSRITRPLLEDEHCAAVQGGIRERDDPEERFFWDSCGQRFYFTRESDRWIERYFGIGFSTVNAAIRRSVWAEYPFGAAPIMEDKKWQQRVVDAGYVIREEPLAAVTHTHNYRLRSLWRRCLSEGFGWRLLGERYSLSDMLRDGLLFHVHRDLVQGLVRGEVRTSAELFFPWIRPFALYWGNHWSRNVKL